MTVSSYGSGHSESRPSELLTAEENRAVVGLVGSRCQTLATTVVQVRRHWKLEGLRDLLFMEPK